MAAEIKVPSLGESVTEATVAKWLKRPGEAVVIDEPVAELETDKITLEVYAPAAGTLAEILADEGANVPVGAVLGRIIDGAAAAPSQPAPHPSPLPAPTLTLPRDAGEGREGARGARERSAESPSPRDSGEREGPAKREGEGQLLCYRVPHMKLPAHSRYNYAAIHKRPQYDWPEGAPENIKHGDTVEIEITGIGTLSNPVVREGQ